MKVSFRGSPTALSNGFSLPPARLQYLPFPWGKGQSQGLGQAGDDVCAKGIAYVRNEVVDGRIVRHNGLHEETEHGNHGQSRVLRAGGVLSRAAEGRIRRQRLRRSPLSCGKRNGAMRSSPSSSRSP